MDVEPDGQPSIAADIHVFEMTREVTPARHFKLIKHTLVTLRFIAIQARERRAKPTAAAAARTLISAQMGGVGSLPASAEALSCLGPAPSTHEGLETP
jgi:hypothetical protein